MTEPHQDTPTAEAPASASTSRSTRWTLWALRLLLVLPTLGLAVGGFVRRWIADDGMINVRIAGMLLGGHGPVFNVGERVEAYTSALWMFTIAALGALGLPLEVGAAWGGLVLSVAGLGLATAAALRARGLDWRGEGALQARVLPLGAMVYAALPPAWDYATSGLETGLTIFWIASSYLLMLRWVQSEPGEPVRARRWRVALAALSLGPLIRPELSIFSLLSGAILAAGLGSTFGEGWRGRARGLAEAALWLGALPIAYQLFRMGYFAALTPNTALAKEAFGSRWDQGSHYFRNFFGLYFALAPLALLLILAWGRARQMWSQQRRLELAVFIAPVLCGLFYVFYVVKVGGGFMHGRMFLPAIFCLITPVAATSLRPPESRRPWRYAAAALLLTWALVCAGTIRVARDNEHGIGDERGWYSRRSEQGNPILAQDYAPSGFYKDAMRARRIASRTCPPERLDRVACQKPARVLVDKRRLHGHIRDVPRLARANPEAVAPGVGLALMRTAIGIRGVVMGPGIHLIDHVGLADPIGGRMVLTKRRRPGHEKRMQTVWMVARFVQPRPGEGGRLRAARRALECAPVAELLEAVRAPMTWSRFWSNVAAAPRLQRLRIHPEPRRAQRELCGVE